MPASRPRDAADSDPGEESPPTIGALEPAATGVQLRRVRVPATDGERRALASVIRLRILRMCLYEPLTNKQIAGRLGKDPATVLHHVRTLLAAGFLRAEDSRPGPRGSREVPYRATGRSWQLDFSYTADDGSVADAPNAMLRAFFEEVNQVPESSVQGSRLGLQLSAGSFAELQRRIGELLDEFAARPPDPDGRRWSLFVAIHPEPEGPVDR